MNQDRRIIVPGQPVPIPALSPEIEPILQAIMSYNLTVNGKPAGAIAELIGSIPLIHEHINQVGHLLKQMAHELEVAQAKIALLEARSSVGTIDATEI